MNLSLKGKKAFVCGSTQGIGRATAIELALLGASVTLIARNETPLQQTAAELPATEGQQHDYIVADFSQPDTLRQRVHAYLQAYPEVHILVNNTGGPAAGPIADAKPEAFLAAFQAHVVCNQLLAQAVAPYMQTANYGRIINIISTSVKEPLKGLGVSNTIRAAVAAWAKTLSAELAPFGITVNNVLPGFTQTGRLESLINSKAEKAGKSTDEIAAAMKQEVPASRFATPEEVAAAAAFLATPAAAYINGINIPVDGGRTSCL